MIRKQTKFTQVQIDLQKMVQLQEQDIGYFTLGSLLSGLETIAYLQLSDSGKYRFIKKYFGYNPKSVQDKKNIDQLITEIRIQSKSFHILYDECCDKNDGNYWFPKNLSREDILYDIIYWKKLVAPEYKIYYDNIIYILKGEGEKVEYPKLIKINKKGKTYCDPEKLINPNIEYNNYSRTNIKKNYFENKNFNNKLEFFKNDHCVPAFEKMNERYKKALETHNKNCIYEYCYPTQESLL